MTMTMLSEELLHMLCCPACKEGIHYDPEHDTLTCSGCYRVYRVIHGIPILLVADDHE
jgi:uncharacterized protein YbaR (Trm112 family)